MKRVLDLLLTAPAILVVLPLLLPLMLLLRLTGEGEVLYGQPRIGRGGRTFRLWKLVTMRRDSPHTGTGTVTVRGDPRVLPVGRILRKTKLNELPQLFNVLVGDMSLVGPRPMTPQTHGFYTPGVQAAIATVPPGLTGVGSVAFRDEESLLAASDLPPLEAYEHQIAPRKGAMEQWYVAHRTLPLDLRLLLLTVVVVVAPRSRLPRRWLPGAFAAADAAYAASEGAPGTMRDGRSGDR